MSRRTVEIESLAAFDARIGGAARLSGWFVQSVDLRGRSAQLAEVDPRGAVFLGCRFEDGTADRLRSLGELLFPTLPDLPFDPYRPDLYRPGSLLGDGPYAESPDASIYAWAKSPAAATVGGTLASTLHDHAMADALADTLARSSPDRLVGVMGGHALRRDEPGYADAVRLAAELARAGRVVLTGGGPGAMEAANLGARLAQEADEAQPGALALLARAPSFGPSVDAWLAAARQVRRQWPSAFSDTTDTGGSGDTGASGATGGESIRSIGIPTWFYGHEPPNAFSDVIAKFFANPLREDTLLSRCRGGVVFLPGEAGTVQEIFTAATENYYAADRLSVAPMVLLGRDYWRHRLPAWSLLQRLSAGRPMADVVACVDTVDEAVAVLTAR